MAVSAARKYPASRVLSLVGEGLDPLLAKLLAARGLARRDDLGGALGQLAHHSLLKGAQEAAEFLLECIVQQSHLVVIADYDCDGATACAVAVRGLRSMGARVDYVVPDRKVHGYGLTPGVVDLAVERFPGVQVLVTVDNGVASHAGVDRANERGLPVVVTDHHLPSKLKPLPAAKVVVDPAQEGCEFPSKNLAGVGVIWYVLWALKDALKARGMPHADFQVSSLLPLVAVGSIADVVLLDRNNRILVQAGLDKIRRRNSFAGIEALAQAGKFARPRIEELRTSDIGFGIGPRINAAGRLLTMELGIDCLLCDDPELAQDMANRLDEVNQLRKSVEQGVIAAAVSEADSMVEEGGRTIVVGKEGWHAGVIGIVAGRLKERRYRPTFVLSISEETGELKGSGRSIPGFNLKDALDQVDKACPGLMPKFGGHAMAAGVSLRAGGLEEFHAAFEAEAAKCLNDELLLQLIEHDGALSPIEISPQTSIRLGQLPWGQGFPEPSFCNVFTLLSASLSGERKDVLTMEVGLDGFTFKAVKYRFEGEPPAGAVALVYKLSHSYNKYGKPELKLLVEAILNA